MAKGNNGWTEERRQAQAERCRQNKPWENATGPTSAAGKARVSQNAFKHGMRTIHYKNVAEILTLNREILLRVNNFSKHKLKEDELKEELIKAAYEKFKLTEG